MITQPGARSKMTVKPPHTACAATPSGSSERDQQQVAPERAAAATPSTPRAGTGMATTLVIMRLPNSISVWVLSSGVKLVPLQRGQSEQPRPEPVSRTAAPEKTMIAQTASATYATIPELARGERAAEKAHQALHCGNRSTARMRPVRFRNPVGALRSARAELTALRSQLADVSAQVQALQQFNSGAHAATMQALRYVRDDDAAARAQPWALRATPETRRRSPRTSRWSR